MKKTKNHHPNSRESMREHIVSKLYQMDLTDNFIYKPTKYDFVNEALASITQNLSDYDALLEASLFNWKLNRLSYVDRAILRLAAFEMKHTPTGIEIIIDQALNLTHKYSDEGDKKHVSFNNRVLENIAKNLNRKE